jgi:hypothetical protein
VSAAPRHATVLDRAGLLALFGRLRDRRLVGVVDDCDCVELVFEDPDDVGGNLVTIYTESRYRGHAFLGFVARELIEAGYGAEEGPAA